MTGRSEFDFHRSALNPLVDLERTRHHGHQIRSRHLDAGPYQNENNAGKSFVNGVSSSSSSTSSGEESNNMWPNPNEWPGPNRTHLSALGREYREPPRSIQNHDLNDRKQLELIHRTGYDIVQRNGQRIYGGPPPNWQGPPPSKGTEIFVGKIPRDMVEWELVPIFEKYGKIFELRLMMDFSGSNRGFLFVRYSNCEEAKKATRELNNSEIRPGKIIGVIPSVDNRKLWISGLPKNRCSDEIREEMSKLTDGVIDVSIYSQYSDKTKTRGYAFVEYLTHRHAALARRKLVPGRNYLFDQVIERVDWAEPEPEVPPEVMAKVKILFIRNLTVQISEDEISAAFEGVSNGKVERVKKAKDYAFVHFLTREAAEKAYEATKDNLILDNSCIEVTWSKPINQQIHNQRKQMSKNFTSVKSFPGQMVEQHGGPQPPMPMTVNAVSSPQPLLHMTPEAPMGLNNQHANRNPMITPRPEGGAARMRGLGTPRGTPSPRDCLRMLQNYQMLDSDFAALTFNSAFNGMIPPPPTSPRSNGFGHAFFGNGSGNYRMMAPPTPNGGGSGNWRMMAPPTAMPAQSHHPFYYYGSN